MTSAPIRGGLSALLLQAVMGVALLAPPVVRAQPTGADVLLGEHCRSGAIDGLPCATCSLASGYTPADAGGANGHGAAPSCAVAQPPRFGVSQAWAVTSAAPASTRIHLLYCRWLN